MADLSYSIKSTDSAGKGDGVIGITSISVSESLGSGASRTLSVTVKGRRIDSNYSLESPYCNGSSNLSSFSSGISGILGGDELTFCTFKITINSNASGTATLGSNYYINVGGTSSSSGARSIRVTFNSASGLTPYIPKYTLAYYKPDGSSYASYSYAAGTNFTALTGPTKDSESVQDTTFKITGNANGGYFGSTSITSTSITATKSGTIQYTFSSWNTSSSGTGTTYKAGTSYSMPSYNLYLYPIYTNQTIYSFSNHAISALSKPTKDPTYPYTYTVNYDANGGVINTTSVSVRTTRNWTFGGWSTSSDSTSANANATYETTTTVYAYWTFTDVKGKVTLPTPTRVGYIFLGWGTSKEQTSNLIPAGGQSPEITKDTTFYAIWKADGSVRLYINNTDKYKMAMVWMYYPSSSSDTKPWKLVIPYMKTSSNWKITAG